MHVAHVALHADWNTDPLPDLVQNATRRRRIETTHAGRMVFRRARPLAEPMLMAILPWADEAIRVALAENPLTPARVLHWLAADPCSKVVLAAYGNPSLPQDIREAIQHQGEDLRRLFAGDPTFTDLEQLSRSRDAHIRLAVARHPSAPERLRSRLPNATMIALRKQAILDPITSVDGLMKLANEDRPEFNVLLATRSHLPEEVLNRLTKGTMSLEVEALLAALHMETMDFTQDSLPHFVAGAERHHHRVNPKARLNLGDLFTYALAKETGLPLFFQGTDFANTAIANAMTLLGYGMSDKGVPQPLHALQ
jgi:uncharacterized protein with PIN domain